MKGTVFTEFLEPILGYKTVNDLISLSKLTLRNLKLVGPFKSCLDNSFLLRSLSYTLKHNPLFIVIERTIDNLTVIYQPLRNLKPLTQCLIYVFRKCF